MPTAANNHPGTKPRGKISLLDASDLSKSRYDLSKFLDMISQNVRDFILNFDLFVGHLVVDYLLHSGNARTFNGAINSDSYLPFNLVLIER